MRTLEKKQDIAMGNQQPSSCKKGLTGEGSETRQAVSPLVPSCFSFLRLINSSNDKTDGRVRCGQESMIVVFPVGLIPARTSGLVFVPFVIKEGGQRLIPSKQKPRREGGMRGIETILSSKNGFMKIRTGTSKPSLRNMMEDVSSVENKNIFRFIIGITEGTMSERETGITTSTTWSFCAEPVMEDYTGRSRDGQEDISRVFLAGRPTVHTTQEGCVVDVWPVNDIGCTERPKGDKGIVRPSMKVEDQDVDEVWTTAIPQLREREEIFRIHISKRGRNSKKFSLSLFADKTEGWVGAEIEAAVEEGLYTAFEDDGRELSDQDILQAIADTIPQSKREDNFTARPVSSKETEQKTARKGARLLKVTDN